MEVAPDQEVAQEVALVKEVGFTAEVFKEYAQRVLAAVAPSSGEALEAHKQLRQPVPRFRSAASEEAEATGARLVLDLPAVASLAAIPFALGPKGAAPLREVPSVPALPGAATRGAAPLGNPPLVSNPPAPAPWRAAH